MVCFLFSDFNFNGFGTDVLYSRFELALKVMEQNRKMLNLCKIDLSEDTVETILSFFNHSWLEPIGQQVIHWRPAGCCQSLEESKQKFRTAFDGLLASIPQVPLLYRWKGFDEAAHYSLRGCLCHGLWQVLLREVAGPKAGEQEHGPIIAEDDPDAAPALQQKVRLLKTLKLFTEEDVVVASPWILSRNCVSWN